MSEVIIPDTITTIKLHEFVDCNLDTIHLSKNVNSITGAFIGSSITIDPENPNYEVRNNAVFKKGTTTLVSSCSTTVIPDDTTVINSNQFFKDFLKFTHLNHFPILQILPLLILRAR